VTKRTMASKRATNHFILNWNKMFERRGWRATKRAMATVTRVAGDGEGESDGGNSNGGGDVGYRQRLGRWRGRQRWWASNGDDGRKQRAMARAARAAMATATRVAGDEEDYGVEEGNESLFS
jgi:hypothetical protein